MSTSEFDRQWEEPDLDISALLRRESASWELPVSSEQREQLTPTSLPVDFTEEDIAFAQEMGAMFAPGSEEMPPYYVQTLLEAESPRFQVADEGIEYKTKARVFKQLHLHHRLFMTSRSRGFALNRLALPRPVIALFTACLLFMVFTMVATGPSFASGLALLLSGPHSGVMQVNGYPHYTNKPHHLSITDADIATRAKQVSLPVALQQLQFSMYQSSYIPDSYTLSNVSLYQSNTRDWSNGPIMEMDYSYTYPGSRHATAQISICEFKPNGQVYQVVEVGAASFVRLGRDGSIHAIYVDGEWVGVNRYSRDWLYGSRNEIIYERDGVVFWIASNGGANIDANKLLSIAASLKPLNTRAIRLGAHINVTVSDDTTSWPFASDLVFENGPAGSSLEIVGADTSSASTHTVTNMHVSP